ncbi:hypothetical protein RY831_20060 [Noviherbaspirillum sp. CPCC 100848]|uniref:DUF1440 domain-containing protein n=1 Tax=Noviherbaspirillum album TaxID=3080276 RepID=A0ABU6JCT6_9BURK|nr:hypothetical protein [Noviherbaspirillum sp. CPCC 100848]MEC4721464.1 hypothetical protein [Noviherbaspirillum sp. CPCC 100848]
MRMQNDSWVQRTLISGTVSGVATALAASVAGKRDAESYAAPLNATSHILWGDEAAQHDEPSLKYTVTGFLLTHASAIFWASIYEKWFAPREEDGNASPLQPLIGAAVVTAGAYVTDYYLVPRRFTPGYEKRVSGKSLTAIYGVLALGLAARALMARRDNDHQWQQPWQEGRQLQQQDY